MLHNRLADADRVREMVAEMSDVDHVARLIHTTDRREEKRRRGEDIHSGALGHLLRLVDEALTLPRQWLSLVELLGGREDRLRDLLEEAHRALGKNLTRRRAGATRSGPRSVATDNRRSDPGSEIRARASVPIR